MATFAFEWDDDKAARVAKAFASSVPERQHAMKKLSTKTADLDIPEYTREQLGKGVRGKYYKRFIQGSNVVILRPEVQKAFPTSEAVNEALLGLLTLTAQTARITGRAKRAVPRKRAAA